MIIDWLAAIMLPLIGILFGLFVAGTMMVGYFEWVLFIPIWFWFRTFDLSFVSYSIVIMMLFFFSTRPEIRTIAKYRREGKLEEYMQGLYDSSPRWRGMKRMQETVGKLGNWRFVFGIIVLILIVLLFMNLNLLPF